MKQIIGKEEWVALPDLELPAIKARVDTGARTSSLHAFDIKSFTRNGEKWVRFTLHPIQKDKTITIECEAPLIERRVVKSSNGVKEKRPLIETTLEIAGKSWPILVTLTNRDSMGYRMLLGREGMVGRMIVDPEFSFTQGRMTRSTAKTHYSRKKKEER